MAQATTRPATKKKNKVPEKIRWRRRYAGIVCEGGAQENVKESEGNRRQGSSSERQNSAKRLWIDGQASEDCMEEVKAYWEDATTTMMRRRRCRSRGFNNNEEEEIVSRRGLGGR